MTYKHLEGESNQDRQARLEAEYAAYVADHKSRGIETINYMNWVTSKKFTEKIANGERAFDRRHAQVKIDKPDERA